MVASISLLEKGHCTAKSCWICSRSLVLRRSHPFVLWNLLQQTIGTESPDLSQYHPINQGDKSCVATDASILPSMPLSFSFFKPSPISIRPIPCAHLRPPLDPPQKLANQLMGNSRSFWWLVDGVTLSLLFSPGDPTPSRAAFLVFFPSPYVCYPCCRTIPDSMAAAVWGEGQC